MELTTTKERVLEAAKCSTPKEALKKLFPEAFKIEFEPVEKITVTKGTSSNPFGIVIGFAWAPHGYYGKCLMVHKTHCTVEKYGDYYVIKPIL